MLAERLRGLISGEAGAIGGSKLVEDAAWLAEVDRLEVEAIDDRRGVQARLDHSLPPLRLLGALRARAAIGSELAVSLATHREGLDSEWVAAVANSRRGHPGESWLTILPAAAHLELLGRAGWQVSEGVDAAELGTGAEPGRSLLVTARPSAGTAASEEAGN